MKAELVIPPLGMMARVLLREAATAREKDRTGKKKK